MAKWLKLTEDVRKCLEEQYIEAKQRTEEFYDEKITGKVYYISSLNGSDENDGKTPDTPWKTCSMLKSLQMSYGDTVLFECGSAFREQIKITNGITYSSYGKGEKPLFYGSIDASAKDAWEKVGEDLYRYKKHIDMYNDIGNIVFDGGKAWGIKIQKCDDADRSLALNGVTNGIDFFEKIDSVPFEVPEQLPKVDLAYFHSDDGYIFLCSKIGTPTDRFSSIELSESVKIFNSYEYTENVTFSNLHFACIGCFAIRTGGCKNITVRNCSFEFIGGAIQFYYKCPWRNYKTRYGNAIENWGSCDGMIVENCYFNQIYDAGVTTQSNDATAIMKNLFYCDNVFDCNQYAIELWGGGSESSFENMRVERNICRGIGDGFTTQRPDKGHESFFNSKGRHKIANCCVTGNVSNGSVGCMLRSNRLCSSEYEQGYFFDENVYIHENGKCFALISKDYPNFSGDIAPIEYNETTVGFLENQSFERNGKFYYI